MLFFAESGFPTARISIQTSCWGMGASMDDATLFGGYSRTRACRADAGDTVRAIAEALRISPSCVTKWRNLRRETGGLAPGKIGAQEAGSVRRDADWLRERIRSGPFTLRKLTSELAARGIKTDRAGGLDLCSRRGAELQKKRSGRPSRTAPISPVNGRAGRRIKTGLMLRAWSLSMRPGSRPTWRRCAAGGRMGSVSRHPRLSAIGRP